MCACFSNASFTRSPTRLIHHIWPNRFLFQIRFFLLRRRSRALKSRWCLLPTRIYRIRPVCQLCQPNFHLNHLTFCIHPKSSQGRKRRSVFSTEHPCGLDQEKRKMWTYPSTSPVPFLIWILYTNVSAREKFFDKAERRFAGGHNQSLQNHPKHRYPKYGQKNIAQRNTCSSVLLVMRDNTGQSCIGFENGDWSFLVMLPRIWMLLITYRDHSAKYCWSMDRWEQGKQQQCI